MKRWRLNPLVKGLALALALLGAPAGAGETPTGQAPRESLGIDDDAAISGNPAATNAKTGTGWLGKTLGIPANTGVTLGGLWLLDANKVLSGGAEPGAWSFNSALVISLDLDAWKLFGWQGASFGVQFLQFNGQDTNGEAGTVQGYNGIVATPPFTRSELYQAWYLQKIIPDVLQVRLGRVVPTYDFNNVMRPVTMTDSSQNVPSLSGLLFTPVFVNTSLLGVMPGYYNSTDGVTVNFTPGKHFYLNLGAYDGNLARGVQTGLTGPSFNGYYFMIAETGVNWTLGPARHPGEFAVGAWRQTGILTAPGVQEDGTSGFYLFGSQRLWTATEGGSEAAPGQAGGDKIRPGQSGPSSIGIFYQYGKNDSQTLPMAEYFGGGVTGFGLVPGRPDDSIGVGVAYSRLNPVLFSQASETMYQAYYQTRVFGTVFLQPTISFIPDPGAAPGLSAAWTATLRMTVLF